MALSLTDSNTIKQAEVKKLKEYLTGEAFSSISSEKIYFAMEYYQREYEWKKEHVEQLLNTIFNDNVIDIVDSNDINDDASKSEIGTIIIQPWKENIVSIMDGQQRTTTVSLIALFLEVIVKNTKKILENKFENNNLHLSPIERDDAKDIYFSKEGINKNILLKILGNTSEDESIIEPKLQFINDEDFNSFYKILIKKRSDVVNMLCKKDNDKIKTENIFELYSGDNKSKVKSYKDCIAALIAISNFFETKLDIKLDDTSGFYYSNMDIKDFRKTIKKLFNTLITIEIFSNKVNSSLIFQNKNNTGKELSAYQLIKNSIILAYGKNSGSEINTFFKSQKMLIEDSNFEDYLFTLFKIYYEKETKENYITGIKKLAIFFNYGKLDENKWTNEKTKEFYKLLKDKNYVYKNILNIENDFIEFKNYFYILNQLGLVGLYLPILLKFYPNKNNKEEIKTYKTLLKEIIKIYLLTICNNENNTIIRNNVMNISVLPELLFYIENNKNMYQFILEKTKIKEIKNNTSDELLKKIENYNFKQYRKGILYLYEKSLQHSKIEFLEKNILHSTFSEKAESEHIIPVNQSKLKKHYMSYKILNNFEYNQIGNFIILDHASNKKAKNDIFINKKLKVYESQKSQLKQIDELCQKNDFYTIEDIKERTLKIMTDIYRFVGLY